MEVMRARRARQALLDVALRSQSFGPVLSSREYLILAERKLPQEGSIDSAPELNPDPLDEQENRGAAIAEVVLKSSALDRYERFALSRSGTGAITRRDEKETLPIAPSIRSRRRSTVKQYEAKRTGEAALRSPRSGTGSATGASARERRVDLRLI